MGELHAQPSGEPAKGRATGPTATRTTSSSKYKGVCFHKGTRKFVAQHSGKTIGAFNSEVQAAQALVTEQGLKNVKVLKKTKRELPPEPFRARFRSLGKVYCRKGSALLPGDLENGKKLWSDAKVLKAFEAEPFLEYMCVRLKYGPWRERAIKDCCITSRVSGLVTCRPMGTAT